MDSAQSRSLRKMVTRCREVLEKSVFELLEGKYGIHREGTVEDIGRLIHLADEDRKGREEIVASLDHLKSFGLDARAAVEQLAREVAFTHLNRLCALKMIEQRGFIREAVGRGHDSRGFKYYLADNPGEEAAWLAGEQDAVYSRFLQSLAGALEEEIGSLFSRNDPANRLFLPPRALKEVLDLINDPGLNEVWKQDETIGWVYQYFTPKELKDKARKESQAPRDSYELAFRNQFYTPRYVVRFLVDNTLGRTWWEMRGGDTRLSQVCKYMLQPADQAYRGRTKKDPRDIRIIDPACGSGHFLLYCFDLLQVIYEEAYQDTASPPSAATGKTLRQDYPNLPDFKRQIPSLILEHNLHGIDIDLRSTQIAALALWMRAQRAFEEMGLPRDQRPRLNRPRIVCAEPMPGEEDLRREFLSSLKPSLLGGLVERVFERMKQAGEIGSLLRINDEIRDVLSKAKKQWLARPKQEQLLLLPEFKRSSVEQLELFDVSDIDDESFWQQAEDLLSDALREYATRAENGRSFMRRLFADDANQGLAFVDLCRKTYDVVLMNPPFGEAAVRAKGYIVENYPRSGHDLACAFVERWLSKCEPGGRVGAITTRTPFFLSSSTKWRQEVILKEGSLEAFADLGYGVLDAMVETAAYVVAKGSTSDTRAVFLRLLKEKDKAGGLLEAIQEPHDKRRFVASPASFSQVPNSPFCYWVSDRIRRLFVELPPFEGEGRTVRVGLQTSDDFRFVRAWWEIPPEKEARSREETLAGRRWVPFAKGGAYSPYYADIHLVVNWENDGEEIKEWICRRYDYLNGKWEWVAKNVDFYFRPGLTWPRRTQSGLNMRVLPQGCIFADKGPTAFLRREAMISFLAVCHSLAFQHLLSLQMAFGSFEAGAVQRTPVPMEHSLPSLLGALALDCIRLRAGTFATDETTRIFRMPAVLSVSRGGLAERFRTLQLRAENTGAQMADNQRQIDGVVFDLYGFGQEDRKAATAELEGEEAVGTTDDQGHEEDFEQPEVDAGGLAGEVKALLSWCVGVVFGRFDVRLATGESPVPDLGDPFDLLPIYSPGMLAERQVPEHYPLRIDDDGILVDDQDHADDIVRRVRDVLQVIWKDRADEIEQEACSILGVRDLREYFRRAGSGGFFDDHIKRYSKSRRKAPIYWLLQSGRRNYGVWVYYHRFDRDLLFKVLENYVRPRIHRQENLLVELRGRLKGASAKADVRRLERELEKHEILLNELDDFRKAMERAAKFFVEPEPFEPDLNDGVVLNIAPLWEVVPWAEAKKYWNDLVEGKYEWSSMAGHIRNRRKSGIIDGKGH